MLKYQGVQAAQLAYDRPSNKLMGFLAKHFNLTKYVQQNNNYVVFEEYFDNGNLSDSQTMSKRNSVTSESNSMGDGM